jgi:hypothetical protein
MVYSTGRRSIIPSTGHVFGAFGWKRAFFGRKSVLANAVRKYVHNRGKYAAQLSETAALEVRVFRFRTPRQAQKWLAAITREASTWPDAPESR